MSATATTTITNAHTTLEPAPAPLSGSVRADINFFTPPTDGSAPYNWVEKQPEGVPQNNYGTDTHNVEIRDMREHGAFSNFELDKFGFTAVKAGTSPGVDFSDDKSIETDYYPEVEQLLRDNIPGTHKVVIFDHTVRRYSPNVDMRRGPVMRAHIDQTARSAAWRVPLHVPDKEEADRLLAGRYRIVNVWRPINGTVESHPLAVGDSQTFPEDKLMPVEHRYPNRTGETAGVVHSDKTQWYYLSGMRNDERLFLQCYDSVSGSRVPHTAFIDPRSTDSSRPRESIEVRALVFG